MIDNILNSLDKVKTIGHGKYKSLCPAHNDSNPSLSITEEGDKILLKCWSGCSTQEILNSANLSWGDLFLTSLSPEKRTHQKQLHEIKAIKESLTVLEIAKNTRALGEKLSNEDLQLEREAWLKVRG